MTKTSLKDVLKKTSKNVRIAKEQKEAAERKEFRAAQEKYDLSRVKPTLKRLKIELKEASNLGLNSISFRVDTTYREHCLKAVMDFCKKNDLHCVDKSYAYESRWADDMPLEDFYWCGVDISWEK